MSQMDSPFPRRQVYAGAFALMTGPLFGVAGTHAQGASPSVCLPPQAEERMLQRETALLGKMHARDHAMARRQQCEVERGIRAVPAKGIITSPRTALQQDTEVMIAASDAAAGVRTTASSSAQNAATTAKQVGRWSTPFGIPVVGVTSVLLRTGKVLFWSYDPASWHNPTGENNGIAYIWDPKTREGYNIEPPENIWCAGQTVLADGRVFLAGGNLRYPDLSIKDGTGSWQGSLSTYTFNPLTERFTRQPDMVQGRWYPTTTQLADNRVVITSGWDETGSETINKSVEVFTPSLSMDGVGTINLVSTHGFTGYYPLQFLLPSGSMLEAGPDWTSSNQLNPGNWTWSPVGSGMRHNHYGMANGISYTDASVSPPRQVIMLAGGLDWVATVRDNEFLEGTNVSAGWREYPKWLQPRQNSNTVILPDGTVLTIGGNRANNNFDDPLLQAELYPKPPSNSTGVWQEVAAPAIQSAYHSTAILLPDATVLLSQDDMDRTVEGAAQHKAQIYSPAYLFKGTRPKITGSPDKLAYGQSFTITADREVANAMLIAPGATTHGNDMHQRAVKLPVTARNNTLVTTLPGSSALVPPGFYMLFVLDKTGIPSVAKFVGVS